MCQSLEKMTGVRKSNEMQHLSLSESLVLLLCETEKQIWQCTNVWVILDLLSCFLFLGIIVWLQLVVYHLLKVLSSLSSMPCSILKADVQKDIPNFMYCLLYFNFSCVLLLKHIHFFNFTRLLVLFCVIWLDQKCFHLLERENRWDMA